MSVEGIIFSNIHDSNISELTRQRTLASVPFGCRYRLIDFPLSNMVSSNINNISVITHYNYHSLMDHIGSGKDWDLARRSGGVKILPPYITAYANNMNSLYRTRLEALKSVNYSIQQMTSDYVVMSDCDVICNIDLNDMINDHIESGADITIAVKYMPLTRSAAKNNTLVFANDEGRITDLLAYPRIPDLVSAHDHGARRHFQRIHNHLVSYSCRFCRRRGGRLIRLCDAPGGLLFFFRKSCRRVRCHRSGTAPHRPYDPPLLSREIRRQRACEAHRRPFAEHKIMVYRKKFCQGG